jgi:hypothetical protein
MRGVQYAILALFWGIGILIIIAASFSIFPWLSSGKVSEAVVRSDVYMMDSALDAAQAYSEAGLQFSNYQACYELMKNGGNTALDDANSVTSGGTRYGVMPIADTFRESLRKKVEDTLNGYSRHYLFLDKYDVVIPSLGVALKQEAGSLTAEVSSSDKVSIRKTVTGSTTNTKANFNGEVVLERPAGFSKKLGMDCLSRFNDFKVYDGLMKLAYESKVANAVDELKKGIVKDSGSECEQLKSQKEDDIRSVTLALAQPSLTTGNEDVNYKIERTFLSLDLGVQLDTPIEPIADGADKGKYLCKFKVVKPAEYAVKVAITDTTGDGSSKVPVWNGDKIAYESIGTVFVVKSG